MESLSKINDDLVKAVVIWTGYGKSAFPIRNDQLIIEKFGFDRGNQLVSLMIELKDAFYSSEAKFKAPHLAAMGDMAINDFKKIYPGLDEVIAMAFSWCYTYDYK